MRIVLHDYPGHAFPLQLARALAGRGHEVLHLCFREFQSPKGPLAARADDPPTLTLEAIPMPASYRKYSLLSRALNERHYGSLLAARAALFRPDVILGGNGPLDPQAALLRLSRRQKIGFVFWLQDLYGLAMAKILRRRLGPIGTAIGGYYHRLEQKLWRRSDAIIAITEDFCPILRRAGIADDKISIIENWAPLADLPLVQPENEWASAHHLTGKTILLYSGTLGLKHNPMLLIALAKALRDRPATHLVVISEGVGAEMIAGAIAKQNISNISLLPFQAYDLLPQIVAAARLLVVILEQDAGIYSVPSKLLTYLAAGRPILGAIPLANLAARIITDTGAGFVVAPDDAAGLVAAAKAILDDQPAANTMGAAGRRYAETHFAIGPITDRIEAILMRAVATAKS